MAVQFVTYDDNNMQAGTFYLVEVNRDDANNLRPITTITGPLNQATQDIIGIKAKNDFQDIKINNLETRIDDYDSIILDNKARINNLEDTEIEKMITFLDRISITKYFENSTRIEIQYNRKMLVSTKVYELIESTNNIKKYIEVDTGINVYQEIKSENGLETKKIIIESNRPFTGYAILI